MCGRFVIELSAELLAEVFGLATVPEIRPSYNVAPTQIVPVVREVSDHRSLVQLKWGLVPPWAKDPGIGSQMINARSETVAQKPSFRHAIKYHRCIVPVSGWYEWQHVERAKIPYYFHLKDGRPLGLAGIWEEWRAPDGTLLDTFSILTTAANEIVAPVHDRMPVVVPPDAYSIWLSKHHTDPAQLEPLYPPVPISGLEVYPVSDYVNSPRNNSPECIRRINREYDRHE